MKIKKKLGMFQVAMLWFDFTKEFGSKVHIFSAEKATKVCEISTIDLSYVVTVKSTVEISQNFVSFSEYKNFMYLKNSSQLQCCQTLPVFFTKFLIPHFCMFWIELVK